MLELYFLIISIIIILVILYYTGTSDSENTVEPFDTFYLSACPTSYKVLYDSNGNTMCCDGDILANKCMGDNQCSLNGKGNAPNCVDMILKEYEVKGKSQCPSSLQNYFEDKTNNKKGCTASALNNTLTGPKDNTQGKCIIYDNIDQNMTSIDSCYNQKQMDDYQCFGDNCTKSLVQPVANKPVLVSISFTDTSGIHRVAYTKQSMEAQLDSTNPGWRNKGIDLSKNIQVADVAKAVYVDKTMSASDV